MKMPDLDDLLDDDLSDGSDLVKQLRAALKSANKEKADQAKRLAELEKGQRTKSLADVLKEKGVSEKVAKLYPSDADVSAEAVDAWLGEYGDVFGIEKQETAASDEAQEAASRISGVAGQAPSGTQSYDVNALIAEIQGAKTPEALAAAMEKAGLK
jgi:hypothetical protein